MISLLAILAVTAAVGAVSTANFVNDTLVNATEGNSVVLEKGAAVRKQGRYENGEYGEVTPAIRFSATVNDVEKDYGMIIVPKSYVEALGETTDYYGGLVGEDKTYVLYEYKEATDIGYGVDKDGNLTSTRMIRGALDQIKFDNINKEFMAIVYEDTGAEKIYDTVNLSNARSVAYVSAAALNAGETGDILVTNVKNAGYDLLGVDFVNEAYTLGTQTFDTYEEMAAELDYTQAFELAKSKTYTKIGATIPFATENMQKISFNWVSSNTDVATVDEDGDVSAIGAGQTTITAYVGASLETAIFKTSCVVDVYSEADYNKIIDPLNSGDSSVMARDYYGGAKGEKGTLAFDEEMGAYKYTYSANSSDTWYDHRIGYMTASEEYQRYAAGRYEYSYLAVDVCFEGTGGTVNVDYNGFSIFVVTSGTENKMTAGKEFFRLDFGELKRYDENGTAVAFESLKLGQWYTIYVPMADGYELTTAQFAFLFASQPVQTTETGATPNYWLRNLRFSELPVKILDGGVLGVTDKNVGQFAGDGWTLTKAPAGVNVIAGNQISLTVAGEYTATNGTQTVNFKILSEEDYAAVLDLGDGSMNSFTTRANAWATVTYDQTVGAYKVTQTIAKDMSEAHGALCVDPNSQLFTKYQENYTQYKYIAFDICVDGDIGVDYDSLIFYSNGGSDYAMGLASSYILLKDMDGNTADKTQMKKGVWYTVYVPAERQLAQKFTAYFFVSQRACKTNEDGYNVYVPYWVKNIRFDTKLA